MKSQKVASTAVSSTNPHVFTLSVGFWEYSALAPCSFIFDFIIAHPQLPAYFGGALLAGNFLLHSPHIGCREFPNLRSAITLPQSYFFFLLTESSYHAEFSPHAADIAETYIEPIQFTVIFRQAINKFLNDFMGRGFTVIVLQKMYCKIVIFI